MRLYRQFSRVLTPRGRLVFDAVNAVVSQPLRDAQPDAYPIYDKLYDSVDAIRTELVDAGFSLLEATPVQRWFPLQYKAQVLLGPRSQRLCRAAIRLLERLRSGPPLEWIIVARSD